MASTAKSFSTRALLHCWTRGEGGGQRLCPPPWARIVARRHCGRHCWTRDWRAPPDDGQRRRRQDPPSFKWTRHTLCTARYLCTAGRENDEHCRTVHSSRRRFLSLDIVSLGGTAGREAGKHCWRWAEATSYSVDPHCAWQHWCIAEQEAGAHCWTVGRGGGGKKVLLHLSGLGIVHCWTREWRTGPSIRVGEGVFRLI